MRLFLALDIPDADKSALAATQSSLTNGRRVDPELFHITLAYLGSDVSHDAAEDVHVALDGARLPRAEVRLEGVGHFGHDLPNAIWVPVQPADALQPLHAKVSRIVRMCGLDVPRRKFVPHVTLARYSRGDTGGLEDFAKIAARRPPLSRPPFVATELHLMRSHLKAAGPEYEVLASYPLW